MTTGSGPRLHADARITARGDGTWVVADEGCRAWMVTGEIEAELCGRLDGRPVAAVAREHLDAHGRVPFRVLHQLLERLSRRSLLEGAEDGGETVPRWNRWRLGEMVLWRGPSPSAVPAPRSSKAWLAAGIVAAVLATAFVIVTGLPPLGRVLLPDGRPWMGLGALAGVGSALGCVRYAIAAAAARLSGAGAGPIRVLLFVGLPALDIGGASLVRAARTVRVGVALLRLAVPAAAGATLRVAAPDDGGDIWQLASLAALGFALLEACPFGPTAAQSLFRALTEEHGEPAGAARAYLRRRVLRRTWSGEMFAGERVLVAWTSASVAWSVLALAGVVDVSRGNLLALVQRGAGADGVDRAALWALAAGLVLLAAATFVSFVVVVGGTWLSAMPRPRRRVTGAGRETAEGDFVDALRRCALFRNAPEETLARLGTAARSVSFTPGTELVRQGDVADAFYVLTRGSADVVIERPSGTRHVAAQLEAGAGFGESALAKGGVRTATVRATTPGAALMLSATAFNDAVKETGAEDLVALVQGANLLTRVPLFEELQAEAISELAWSLRRESIAGDDVVIRAGDPGDRFYLVLDGEVRVLGPDDTTVAELTSGAVFGEIALLADVPRSATVCAKGGAQLLWLDRATFLSFLERHLALGARIEDLGAQRLSSIPNGSGR